MFRKLVLTIFFYAFLNTVMKTGGLEEGGLITDFRTFREYTNIRSNDADEKSVQEFRQSESMCSSLNRSWHISLFLDHLVITSFPTYFINL